MYIVVTLVVVAVVVVVVVVVIVLVVSSSSSSSSISHCLVLTPSLPFQALYSSIRIDGTLAHTKRLLPTRR